MSWQITIGNDPDTTGERTTGTVLMALSPPSPSTTAPSLPRRSRISMRFRGACMAAG